MEIRQWVSSPTHTWKELLDRLESIIAQNETAMQAMDEATGQRRNPDPQAEPAFIAKRTAR